MSDDFQSEIHILGIEPSPAFVREPESNGCVGGFIRTLKGILLGLRDYPTLEELDDA